MLSLSSTYIDSNLAKNNALDNDILIAFDGAPGRNAVGLNGAFSSGIYKVICDPNRKGICYFELNSDVNKKIIADHSQGTTILHASKAIPHLICADISDKELKRFNQLFDRLVYLKVSIKKLQKEKDALLKKYFTNLQ